MIYLSKTFSQTKMMVTLSYRPFFHPEYGSGLQHLTSHPQKVTNVNKLENTFMF